MTVIINELLFVIINEFMTLSWLSCDSDDHRSSAVNEF